MEYRKLPHGSEKEKFSVIGLGAGGLNQSSDKEIENIIAGAIDSGINYFDLCGSDNSIYKPFGRAVRGRRDKIFVQMHFGAVYNKSGEYGWSRDFEQIKKNVAVEMSEVGTDYIDFGFLHCVDDNDDFFELEDAGVLGYLERLKKDGVVRHIGFSSHTPSVASMILDTGVIDLMLFSINPAYDFEKGDGYGKGTQNERAKLFAKCGAEGVGISVMKAFAGGQLLKAKTSPFHKALTKYQCIQYALDRPSVLTVLPGVRNMKDLDELIGFESASAEEKDYSLLGVFTSESTAGRCVYCNHCRPCPAGIDIGLVNKYYDLAVSGDKLAKNHYKKLGTKADACTHCGHCNSRCPFAVKQSERMAEINKYFA